MEIVHIKEVQSAYSLIKKVNIIVHIKKNQQMEIKAIITNIIPSNTSLHFHLFITIITI
jgi:hypothetical protein